MPELQEDPPIVTDNLPAIPEPATLTKVTDDQLAELELFMPQAMQSYREHRLYFGAMSYWTLALRGERAHQDLADKLINGLVIDPSTLRRWRTLFEEAAELTAPSPRVVSARAKKAASKRTTTRRDSGQSAQRGAPSENDQLRAAAEAAAPPAVDKAVEDDRAARDEAKTGLFEIAKDTYELRFTFNDPTHAVWLVDWAQATGATAEHLGQVAVVQAVHEWHDNQPKKDTAHLAGRTRKTAAKR